MDRARTFTSDSFSFILALLFGGLLLARVLVSGVTYPESNTRILLILALLAVALASGIALTGRPAGRLSFGDAAFLLFFLVILSLYLCSSRRWLGRNFLVQMGSCTIAYFLASRLARSARARLTIFACISAGALLIALYGLYQRFFGLEETRSLVAAALRSTDRNTPLQSRLYSSAIFSTFFFPNALASYLIVVLPPVAAVFFLGREERFTIAMASYLCAAAGTALAFFSFSDLSRRPIFFAAVACASGALAAGLFAARSRKEALLLNACCVPLVALPAVALLLTASEGAWFALILACLLTAQLRARRYAAGAAAAAAVIALAFFAARSGGIDPVLKDSLETRLEYWRAGARIWKERPLLGFGPGSFPHSYARLRDPGSEEGRMAHNIYLRLASETGVVGLASFLLMWAAAGGSAMAGVRRGNPFCFALSLSIFAFLLHGVSGVGLSVPGTTLTLWTLAGLVAAGGGIPPAASRPRRISAGVCAALLTAVLLFWIIPEIRVSALLKEARGMEARGKSGKARETIRQAIALDPASPLNWSLLGGVFQREGDDRGALTAYRRAASLSGGVASHHFRLAACYWRLSQEGRGRALAGSALEEMSQAIRANPHDVDYRLLRAFWLEKSGGDEDALIEYTRARDLIVEALARPRRIRRHSPADYEKLAGMVDAKIAEMEKITRKKQSRGKN